MQKFEKLASAGYLDRTREQSARMTISYKEYENLQKELLARLTDQNWQKEGGMEFAVKGESKDAVPTTFFIKYDSEFTPELEKYLSRGGGWTPDDDPWDMPTINMDTFRRITSLKIECGDDIFDLSKTVIGRDVFVYIGDEPLKQVIAKGQRYLYGLHSSFAEVIITKFDPTSVFGLIMLLHEIGHHVKEKKYTVEERDFLQRSRANAYHGRDSYGRAVTATEKVPYIENERSADAFAIHTLHRLMREKVDMRKVKSIFYYAASGIQKRTNPL